jgi:hypothetical protein
MKLLRKRKTNCSRDAREILTPCASCPVGVLYLVDLRPLVVTEFNVKFAAWLGYGVQAVQQGDEKLEPAFSSVKGEMRLVIAHLWHQSIDGRCGDIGGVADDEVGFRKRAQIFV